MIIGKVFTYELNIMAARCLEAVKTLSTIFNRGKHKK